MPSIGNLKAAVIAYDFDEHRPIIRIFNQIGDSSVVPIGINLVSDAHGDVFGFKPAIFNTLTNSFATDDTPAPDIDIQGIAAFYKTTHRNVKSWRISIVSTNKTKLLVKSIRSFVGLDDDAIRIENRFLEIDPCP